MCKISINSKEMARDLINIGIVPKKSLILKPPLIQDQYSLAFIAGYFDGDGSIYKTAQNEYGIAFEGTMEMLLWINDKIGINGNLKQRYNNQKNNYYIRCGGINKPY